MNMIKTLSKLGIKGNLLNLIESIYKKKKQKQKNKKTGNISSGPSPSSRSKAACNARAAGDLV